jgi:DNA-binding XRE family transcriptional regulator
VPSKRPSPYAHGRSEIHERRPLVRAIERERLRLGQHLRGLRTARGLTQAQAAEAAGVHPVQVARVEAGSANVTIATLVAFAFAYGVPVAALFNEEQTDR